MTSLIHRTKFSDLYISVCLFGFLFMYIRDDQGLIEQTVGCQSLELHTDYGYRFFSL